MSTEPTGAGEKRTLPTVSSGRPEENGPQDLEVKRIQSYYIVAQEGDPVLFVIKRWFENDNRFIFDAFVRAANIPLDISKGDFYELDCNSPKISFLQMIEAFNSIRPEAASYCLDYAEGKRPDPFMKLFSDSGVKRAFLSNVKHVSTLYAADEATSMNVFAKMFAANLAQYTDELKDSRALYPRRYKHPYMRAGQSSAFEKHRIPAKPDSFVMFAGPHHVSGDPVRRLVAYVHSVNEQGARKILADHSVPRGGKPTYTQAICDMVIPPNAQGKMRSPLVDQMLRQYYSNDWGWTQELYPGLTDELRASLLIDETSIKNAPNVDAPNQDEIKIIRTELTTNSCYVKYDVLATQNSDPNVDAAIKFNAEDFEQLVLNCVIHVLNMGLQKQEALKKSLRELIEANPGLVVAFENSIEPWQVVGSTPDNVEPRHHAAKLKERLKAVYATAEVKEFAFSTLLRSQRKTNSVSWSATKWTDEHKPWYDVYQSRPGRNPYKDPVKVMLSAEEIELVLRPAPAGTLPLNVKSPLGLPEGAVASLPSDYSLWTFMRNISGLKDAVAYRRRLFSEGKIAHPHIGCWTSALKPWCPSLLNPIGNWQNVYQILTLGMFDSHYMPRHSVLRLALKPVLTQAWYAVSRQAFSKLLFTPERFNVRELPKGGSALKWHTDEPAIYPVCPDGDDEDESQGFLDDTSYDSMQAGPQGEVDRSSKRQMMQALPPSPPTEGGSGAGSSSIM